jgi:transposase InsO family protein
LPRCRSTAAASSLPNSSGLANNEACPLFVLPPRSPKLNGQVERSHRTHHEEFYQVVPENWNVGHLNPQLRRWEHIYNTVRPHQALGYLTPLEFLERWESQQKKAECH